MCRPVEAHERGDVDELDDRGDHDRGQRRLGELLEQPGEEQQRDAPSAPRRPGPTAATSRPRTAVDRRLREAAVDDHAAGEAGGEVGRAEAEQLAVRVDLVVVPGRVGLGRAERPRRSRRASRRPRRRRGRGSRRAPTSGRPSDGSPLSMWPTISTPCWSRSKTVTAAMPSSTADERAGHDRRDRSAGRATSAERQRAPTSSVQAARVAELARAGPRAARRSRRRPSRRRTASAAGRR